MKKIKLIGIRGDIRYERWRKNVKHALKELKFHSELEEVNNIDSILDLDIASIPALIINDLILLEQNNHIPDASEIKSSILKYLDQKKNQMKNIIVPTDFSLAAHNAYLYGRDLSGAVGGQLKVMHACYPNIDSINGISIPTIDELKDYAGKQLNTFVQDDSPDSVEEIVEKEMIERYVKIGFPKDEILKFSQEEQADLILMGTTGSGTILDKFFGSISSEISLKAHCPVWLVPPNAKFNGIKNILYAGNYESADGRMMREVSELATLFNANIHMVHVTKKKSLEEHKIQELILERLFNKVAPSLTFKMNTVVNDDVSKGIDQYARKNNIDLVVIITRHRNFWENIRHKSNTKKVVFNTVTPLLIMHLDDVK